MSLLLMLARFVPGSGSNVARKSVIGTDAPAATPSPVAPASRPSLGTKRAQAEVSQLPEGKRAMQHKFENYDDRFSCPNCEEALPFDEFPQTCVECGFLVEVFLTREDALAATKTLEEDSDAITTQTYHVYGLGWVLGHTRLLLA